MNKMFIFLIAISALVFLMSMEFASAYHSNGRDYGSSISYRAPESHDIYPSYRYAPNINDRTLRNFDNSAFSTRSYQGPISERTITFDDVTKVGKRGRFSRAISYKVNEKYAGATEQISTGSQISDSAGTEFTQTSPAPLSYTGGSTWRYPPSYEARDYGSNSYNRDYYYKPRYNSRGFYNWRY